VREIKFFSLSSGSNGNCYYLECEHQSLLIDAGIGIRMIRKRLMEAGVDLGKVSAVLITHEHSDHIRGIGGLAVRHGLPLYGTGEVLKEALQSPYGKRIPSQACHRVVKGEEFPLAGFRITAFAIPHDSVDNVGYLICFRHYRFLFATDIGSPTSTLSHFLGQASHAVLEANYDPQMLCSGSYPPHLQARITGPGGHLSNSETGELLSRVYHKGLHQVWLCHLSGENNRPSLAYQAVASSLAAGGIEVGRDMGLAVLPRGEVSEMYYLD
jgi:phosphoribosyl 1,2-cyclic phosphodiesterase